MADLRDDIEKYLKGEMTPAEMHALEKRALQDPFLAEALDGAQSISSEAFAKDLDTLKKARDSKYTKQTRFTPMRVAAALLVLLASTALILWMVNTEPPATLAEQAVQHQTDSTAVPEDAAADEGQAVAKEEGPKASGQETAKEKEKETSGRQLLALNEEKKQAKAASDAKGNERRRELIQTRESALLAADQQRPYDSSRIDRNRGHVNGPPGSEKPSPVVATESAAVTTTDGQKSIAASLAPRKSASAKADQPGLVTVRGKILSNDGSGLPGVNVTVPKTTLGTVSDAQGYFLLRTHEIPDTITVSFIGLKTAEVPTLQQTDNIRVVMEEDASSLNEVVVAGAGGLQADNADESSVTEQVATPIGGRRAFNQFIADNLKYPAEALAQKVSGTVVVEFTIDPSGRMLDMQIIRGPGSGCREEAMRLLREGPGWKPAVRNQQDVGSKVRVSIRFKLPK